MRMTVFVAAVLALFFVCVPACGRTVDKDYHETFEVAQGASLVLLHGDGDVTITPWDQDMIDVTIHYHADVSSVGIGTESDFRAEFEQTGDTVTVKGIEGGSSGIFFFRSRNEYEYTYTVSAPSYVALRLRGDDGFVRLYGWRADIDCDLDDGDLMLEDVEAERVQVNIEDGEVKIEGIKGDLAVTADDGDVTIRNGAFGHARISAEDGSIGVTDSSGDFEVTVDDGDVDLRRVTVGDVDVRANDGEIDLDITLGAVPHVNVGTDDGDVTMRLSGELSFDYLVTMDDGDVDVFLDEAKDAETGSHRVSGTMGDGDGLIRVRTSDGDVTIVRGS